MTQRAAKNDSSQVVLHARHATFVMLIVSALVVVGAAAEDITRLSRAVEDAEIIRGLVRLWDAETKDKTEPVSLSAIIAGIRNDGSVSTGAFELQLEKSDEGGSGERITCNLDLDLGRRFVVPGQGELEDVVVKRNTRVRSGGELSVVWRNYEGKELSKVWSPTRSPYDLQDFSSLWDLLVSSTARAQIHIDDLDNLIKDGLVIHESEISREYQIVKVMKRSDGRPAAERQIHIASVRRFFEPSVRTSIFGRLFAIVKGGKPLASASLRWQKSGFDSLALSPCRKPGSGSFGGFYIVFPVKFENEDFDWTKAWIDRAFSGGFDRKQFRLTQQQFPKAQIKAGRPFVEAFSDLRREAEGLESLRLESLPKFLQERLDREGPTFEVFGASIPSGQLRSLGLFLILIAQGYAARHMSEAASRMESNPAGDPGAFQPWILLYDGRGSRVASFVILAVPTATLLGITYYLVSETLIVPLSGLITIVLSFILLRYSLATLCRLRTTANCHRADETP